MLKLLYKPVAIVAGIVGWGPCSGSRNGPSGGYGRV